MLGRLPDNFLLAKNQNKYQPNFKKPNQTNIKITANQTCSVYFMGKEVILCMLVTITQLINSLAVWKEHQFSTSWDFQAHPFCP